MNPSRPPDGSEGGPASAEALLRARAEAIAERIPASLAPAAEPRSAEAAERMLHELQVHQIELEMQNDELRRTQAELEVSRARYFDLYDLAPVGYLTTGETGLILEGNITAAELLGVTRASLGQQPLARFVVPGDQDAYYFHRKRLVATGTPQSVELKLIRRGQRPFWARLDANRAMGAKGEQEFRVVVTDIADRKAAEERLRQASAMFESAVEGVVVTDVDGQILLVNRAFCDRTGYSETEALGQTPRMLRSGRHDRRFFDAMWARIEAEGAWKGEIWNRKKSGEVYADRLVIRAVKDDRARVTHYVGVYADL